MPSLKMFWGVRGSPLKYAFGADQKIKIRKLRESIVLAHVMIKTIYILQSLVELMILFIHLKQPYFPECKTHRNAS
jgi:hypothetical protein